ncbi:hypothetical protein C8034_v009166 [Colletotrichum sidae]|uniref:Uncharacterized protein n=2 Tax=Colletotrichum orbiculare species complex TaxID=2707354 RepID=A0A4R8QIN8_9PEZI|nr:hypothetical protein C8035_v001193 [Colletotrichum spinosum]TEA17475.1 hypothetical protein C8034_v009166 [Colletotrichum sidae]
MGPAELATGSRGISSNSNSISISHRDREPHPRYGTTVQCSPMMLWRKGTSHAERGPPSQHSRLLIGESSSKAPPYRRDLAAIMAAHRYRYRLAGVAA